MNLRCFPAAATTTWIVAVAGFLLWLPSMAAAVAAGEVSGEVAAEGRVFTEDASDPRQGEESLSLAIELEYFHDWDEGDQRFAVTPFVRLDSEDDERSHVDLRELYWRRTFRDTDLDLYVGVRKVFWGVTESVHLVDVINQTDLVENLDTEDKLGQPMVQLSWGKDWGTVDFFVLPFFRERTFPGAEGRLRGPLPIAVDDAVYESSAEEWHTDFALRWSHSFGPWDVGLAHFYGTSRQPRLEPGLDRRGEAVFVPHYDLQHQTSLDAQLTVGDWLWKLEAVQRDGVDGASSAAVAGFEYTFYALGPSSVDVGLIGEVQFDDRGGPDFPTLASVANDDVAVGGRLTFNDTVDTDLLAVLVEDLESGSRFVSLEADRRVGQHWEVELQARFFEADTEDALALFFDQEDHVQLTVRRFF